MLFRLEAGSPRAGKEGHHISNARSFTALLRLGLTCLDFTKMLKREKGFQNEIKGCFPKTNVIRRKSNKSRWAGKFHYDRDQTGSKPTEYFFFFLAPLIPNIMLLLCAALQRWVTLQVGVIVRERASTKWGRARARARCEMRTEHVRNWMEVLARSTGVSLSHLPTFCGRIPPPAAPAQPRHAHRDRQCNIVRTIKKFQ